MNNIHLFDKLEEYGKMDYYPFHMPGHKRNIEKLPKWNLYGMDITEIDGFDNLHDAQDILKVLMERMARFRGAEESFYLVNGTTCGLLSGIASCVSAGDEILIGRNCHKAVYHGISTMGLYPRYSYPQIYGDLHINGGILSENIEEMLINHPKIRLVIITSPTYEGVVSNIKEIAKVTHKYGIPLLVDQAHGAHFGMCHDFPESALQQGADIVIESVHKTLPSLTQTALLHVQGNLVDREKIRKYLGIFQTSSPSYIMMAAIDWCQRFCEKEKEAFCEYSKNLKNLRKRIGQLENISLFSPDKDGKMGCYDYDPGKLVFGVKNGKMAGQSLYDCLRSKYHLQLEMAAGNYVIAMTSVMDTREGFERLYKALKEINEELQKAVDGDRDFPLENTTCVMGENAVVFIPSKAEKQKGIWKDISKSEGCVSKSYLYLYPPGIPFLVPGERIEKTHLLFVEDCQRKGLKISGLRDGKIEVVCQML